MKKKKVNKEEIERLRNLSFKELMKIFRKRKPHGSEIYISNLAQAAMAALKEDVFPILTKSNLSLDEMAEKLGLSRGTISLYRSALIALGIIEPQHTRKRKNLFIPLDKHELVIITPDGESLLESGTYLRSRITPGVGVLNYLSMVKVSSIREIMEFTEISFRKLEKILRDLLNEGYIFYESGLSERERKLMKELYKLIKREEEKLEKLNLSEESIDIISHKIEAIQLLELLYNIDEEFRNRVEGLLEPIFSYKSLGKKVDRLMEEIANTYFTTVMKLIAAGVLIPIKEYQISETGKVLKVYYLIDERNLPIYEEDDFQPEIQLPKEQMDTYRT